MIQYKMNRTKLPNIIYVILTSTLIATIPGGIGPIHFSGISWLIAIFFSIYLLIQNKFRCSFPLWTCLPWALVLLFNITRLNYDNSLQRLIMLLCPIIVGCAISTLYITEDMLKKYLQYLRYFCIAFFIIFAMKSKILFTLSLPDTTALAADVMIGMILISIFTITYFNGEKKDIYLIAGLLLVPFIAMTRMAMMTTALTLPLNFSKITFGKRAALCLLVLFAGIIALNTERVQKKMFYSNARNFKKQDMIKLFFKEGVNMVDIIKKNPNLATSGRGNMWKMVSRSTTSDPIFGKGIGACEKFIYDMTYHNAKYPHNDYLLTYFDLGIVGIVGLISTILLLMSHTLMTGLKATETTRVLLLAMSYSFIPFLLMMITDNILVYSSFFGNLQYCTIGIAYACFRTSKMRAGLQTGSQTKNS
ncbi:MAG: hypothetical protein COA79_15730 [Planctomycetota bacterium]|nr:MAG: hypothetical protein COA79_15730 [Planctomycetota bacterium]